MHDVPKNPATMSSCELIDKLELAVMRQSKLRLWLVTGETIEGTVRGLETLDGKDMLQLDTQFFDVRTLFNVVVCE